MANQHLETVWALRNKEALTKYYLLYWSGNYFLSCSTEGGILREGIPFQIRYHRTTRGKILDSCNGVTPSQVALSFRSNGTDHYVLVSLLSESAHKSITV